MSGGLRAVALFAGAGGLDLGAEQAGYSVIFAVENDATAVATLNANRPRFFPKLREVVPLDITQLDPADVMRDADVDLGEVDLLVGGPPCVAFSKSGFHLEYKRAGLDPRASLLDDYVRFLKAMQPKAFLMENVFGLAYQNQSRSFFERLRAGIKGEGYSFTFGILNAADYGAPQNRQRLFAIGARDGRELDLPTGTHWGEHERRVRPASAQHLLPHVTAGDVLAELETTPEPEEAVNGKYGHLLPGIPPGGNYLHYTEHEGHPQPLFRWRSRYWTFLLKLSPERPSPTIQGQPGPYVGPFHWENRRLRVPELKRLHAFPDEYTFAGRRREIQLQVGNAVPPPLGRVVAKAIRIQMEREPISAAERQLMLSLQLVGAKADRPQQAPTAAAEPTRRSCAHSLMTEVRFPSVLDLVPIVEAAVQDLGRATTTEIRDRVLASLDAQQRIVPQGRDRGTDVGYGLRWVIRDLTRRRRIERVAPRTYAPAHPSGDRPAG